MAYEETLKSFTLNADSSVGIYTGVPGTAGAASPNNGKQYCFVKITGAHTCGAVSAVTDTPLGVLQNKPQGTGHAATVGYLGISKVRAAKSVAAGSSVYISSTGLGTDASGSSATKVGVAILAAGAADDLFPVLLQVN